MYRHLRYRVVETCQNKIFRAVNTIVTMFRKIKLTFLPVFRIRIQIWSGFRWVSGSGSGLRPEFSQEKWKKRELSSLLGRRLLLESECPLKVFKKKDVWRFLKKNNIFLCLKDKTSILIQIRIQIRMDASVFSNCPDLGPDSQNTWTQSDVGNPDPNHRFLY